jgi:hypothetical protein
MVYSFNFNFSRKHTSDQFHLLFKRRKVMPNIFNFNFGVFHSTSVIRMQEVDNAAGSFLEGTGNLISVSDWTFFPYSQIYNGRNFFTHKSVLSALAINKNLWPSNGSHTLNMQTLGLMYTGFNTQGNLVQSNHYGYPHLGRPNDHYYVTPFDAVYVDERVDPHILLDEADTGDVNILNQFILNEVEPWYLSLQNQRLGAQARSDYRYKAYRRARFNITSGYDITHTTPYGDYVVEANAELELEAPNYVKLVPCTVFKEGSKVHVHNGFVSCVNQNFSGFTVQKEEEKIHKESFFVFDGSEKEEKVQIYPNPTNNALFFVEILKQQSSDLLEITALNSTRVLYKNEQKKSSSYQIEIPLKTGVYLIKIMLESGELITKKLFVL